MSLYRNNRKAKSGGKNGKMDMLENPIKLIEKKLAEREICVDVELKEI